MNLIRRSTERKLCEACDRQTDKCHKNVNCIRPFWAWTDVNRSIFHEEMRKQRFLRFSFSVILIFDLKFALPVIPIRCHVFMKFEVSIQLSDFE